MKFSPLATLVVLGLSLASARAQFFSTGDLAHDGSNIEAGTPFLAVNFTGTGTAVVVNGVTFTPDAGIPASGTGYTLDNTLRDGGTSPDVTSSDAIFPLVNEGALNLGSANRSMVLTLSGLTVGTTYSAQLIFDTGDTSGRSASVTDNGVTSDIVTAPGAVYITDTFTASSQNEVLTINDETAIGGRTPLNLSAFVVDVVPEPSTWALVALGVVGLAFFQARRATS